jgi:hypothetical protein
MALFKAGVALTHDVALLFAHRLAIQTLAGQLAMPRPFIDQHERQI